MLLTACLTNAKKHKKTTRKPATKFSPYFIAIERNLKAYYEEKNRLLNTIISFDQYDWLEVDSPEIATSYSSS